MKRKSVLALLLIVALFATLVGCTYVDRPRSGGNHTSDQSSQLDNLLLKPVIVPNVEEPEQPPVEQPPVEQPPVEEPPADVEPEKTPAASPFAATGDVFSKINEILEKVKADNPVTDSATGVSADLMKGRTVRIYMPRDFTGNDNAIIKNISNKLGMSVIVNNLDCTGAEYTNAIYRAQFAGEKADLMFVDQEIWGDIHYFTRPINSFINFDIGDELDTFRSNFMDNYIISDGAIRSEETYRDYYVAAGIGAPYLLAYNKANLVTTGTINGPVDLEGNATKIELKDPVSMYEEKTWNLAALTAVLKNSTLKNCGGLATVMEADYNVDTWFGSDGVPVMKIDAKLGSYGAEVPIENDLTSLGGMTNDTLDCYQKLYWTEKGANGKYVGEFVDANDRDNTFAKLFNGYIGGDATTSYAMVTIEADELANVAAAAGEADWDFVGFPYGKTFEFQMEDFTIEENEDGSKTYLDTNGEHEITFPVAGWSAGFAVLKNCANPSVALRFAEEYTKEWRDAYEGAFLDKLSDEQQARYKLMKSEVYTSFFRSITARLTQVETLYASLNGKMPTDTTVATSYSSLSSFSANPEIVTYPMYHKNDVLGIYSPFTYDSWSAFYETTVENINSSILLSVYEPMRVLFYQ